jgi:hypothetical protein
MIWMEKRLLFSSMGSHLITLLNEEDLVDSFVKVPGELQRQDG